MEIPGILTEAERASNRKMVGSMAALEKVKKGLIPSTSKEVKQALLDLQEADDSLTGRNNSGSEFNPQ